MNWWGCMPNMMMRFHSRFHRFHVMGTKRTPFLDLGGTSQSPADHVDGVVPFGYHRVGAADVVLELLLDEDAGYAVAYFELVGHERVSFAFPHACGEREFEQDGPHLGVLRGVVRPRLPPAMGALTAAAISSLGCDSSSILCGVSS